MSGDVTAHSGGVCRGNAPTRSAGTRIALRLRCGSWSRWRSLRRAVIDVRAGASTRRRYDAWHDRAVFPFLAQPGDRDRYVSTAMRAVRSGGSLVLGTFASDGPTRCSGLPTARYDADELAAQFSTGFERKAAWGTPRWMRKVLPAITFSH